MNLHLFQNEIFRDRTRLRCTKDGRLLIKTKVALALRLEAASHLHYMIHQVDQSSGILTIVFSKSASDRGKQVYLNDIKGTKILVIKSLLREYSLSSQYVTYQVEKQDELWVTFKLSAT